MSVNRDDLELLSAYLDGELTTEEQTRLETRLQVETALRTELEALRQTVALVKSLPRMKAPRDFTLDPAVYGRQQTATNRNSALIIRSVFWQRTGLAAAAASLLLVFLGGFMLLNSADLEESDSTTALSDGQHENNTESLPSPPDNAGAADAPEFTIETESPVEGSTDTTEFAEEMDMADDDVAEDAPLPETGNNASDAEMADGVFSEDEAYYPPVDPSFGPDMMPPGAYDGADIPPGMGGVGGDSPPGADDVYAQGGMADMATPEDFESAQASMEEDAVSIQSATVDMTEQAPNEGMQRTTQEEQDQDVEMEEIPAEPSGPDDLTRIAAQPPAESDGGEEVPAQEEMRTSQNETRDEATPVEAKADEGNSLLAIMLIITGLIGLVAGITIWLYWRRPAV